MGTFQFYENHANDLIPRYESADMTPLHQLLSKYVDQGYKVLDIGIGSGRELQFLYDSGCEIWGVDPTIAFIHNAQKRFPNIEKHFIISSLPKLTLEKKLFNYFDVVISIAVWMHLKKEEYLEAVQQIVSFVKPKGKIVISFSIGKRAVNDDRYFEDIDTEYLKDLFRTFECHLIENFSTDDGLGRNNELRWITLVYCKGN